MIARRITVRDVLDATAAVSGWTRDDLRSQNRHAPLVLARQVAIYVAREVTGLSLSVIGRHVGGRDHSTVQHAARKIGALVAGNMTVAETVRQVRERLDHPERAAAPRERDPLEVAIDVASLARRPTDVSVAEIDDMARCLVGYGRRLGVVALDDGIDADPELLPIGGLPSTNMIATVDRVLAAASGFEGARFSPREARALADLVKSLRSLAEARANMEA